MYKSKLQELCQKQKWALPEYTCIRDGEDHRPLFNASVVVRGVTFNIPTACKSSKQAHNEAAQLAFLHFTSAPSNQGNEKEVRSSIDSEDMTVKQSENLDECIEFKKKLQMYAQKKNLKPPVYCNEEEGTMFRAKVSVDEDWFQSPTLCETMEEAQNSAAEAEATEVQARPEPNTPWGKVKPLIFPQASKMERKPNPINHCCVRPSTVRPENQAKPSPPGFSRAHKI